ncbi:MAG: ABC transporter permease [Betaproteobacteria bacterium]|nr:MAG: ABC transporter permease [Betaproteobacteria bacterium]
MSKSIANPALMPLTARILAIARYTVLEAWRNRSVFLLIGMVVLALLLSLFVRQQAITESDRAQVAFLASITRLGSVFLLAITVLQGSVREFQDKVLELMLSLDLPRSAYLAGKFLGYALLAVGYGAIASLPLLLLSDPLNVFRWSITHIFELWIVIAFALFCITAFSQLLAAATFVLAFYLLARSITAIQLISQSTLSGPGPASDFAALLADAIALVLPRLDAFTQTAWLVEAIAEPLSMTGAIVQTSIYVSLLLCAAMFDLHRRNF